MQVRLRQTGASEKLFASKAREFVKSTDSYVRQDVNPGDYYKAVWCRDASYIMKDWFLSGDAGSAMQVIRFIWSHQMTQGKEKIVYGRGSPDMDFLSQVASPKEERRFKGALPSTIFGDFSEVYARNPDIDSTALMVSTTSWILDNYLRAGLVLEDRGKSALGKKPPRPEQVIDFVVPRMLRAVDYLEGRDTDGDSLLEQDHNEDWMDTVLRAGKIVYSQACWILALVNFSSLLSQLEKEREARRMAELAKRTILAVEEHLWSSDEGCYIDRQESHHLGRKYRTLTQDVSLYLVAITENTVHDMLRSRPRMGRRSAHVKPEVVHDRAVRTLNAIKDRIWKDRWPLVTEAEMKTTRPWVLRPNQYHNHTFWPWTTGIEMLARSRFKRFDECNTLLSLLIRGRYPNVLALHEWVNPVTGKGSGAFPFRTGTSAIRIAIADILTSIREPEEARSNSAGRKRGAVSSR